MAISEKIQKRINRLTGGASLPAAMPRAAEPLVEKASTPKTFVESIPDGSVYLTTQDGKDYYVIPGGNPNNPDDIRVAAMSGGAGALMDLQANMTAPGSSKAVNPDSEKISDLSAPIIENLAPSDMAKFVTELQNQMPGFGKGGYEVPPSTGMAMADTNMLQAMQNMKGQMSSKEMQMLMQQMENAKLKADAPLSPLAEELAMQGDGEDTQLAHLRPGEVVMPPEFMEDAQFEAAVENKFNQFGLDPEKAVVGVGIASLNPMTGLEEFGFFKKLGKSLKKVVKKVAPVALPLLIPGVGGALSGGLSSLGGALGIPSGIGSSFLGGKGVLDTLGGIRGGIGSFFGGLGGGSTEEGSDQQQQGGRFFGMQTPDFIKNIGDRIGLGGMSGLQDVYGENFMGGGQQQVLYDAQGNPVQVGGGGMSPLSMLGIGGLAAGLGKLAYEDAKKQTGVALTPLTTMSPTGRYNIEAEIARRMGQSAPNPVEFGLLPQGTIPQLSGGKPLGSAAGGMGAGMIFEKPPVMAKSLGGAIEELQGGMAPGMMYGGPVMAYAEGGAVQMQEGGEMDPSQFPRMDGDINGPGTETSDDIPAMLSDGEFVMTGRAVRGAGSYNMEQGDGGIISLVPSYDENRERGMDLMYQMMDVFANNARPA